MLIGYIVYLVVTGQMGQFWAAMSSVQMPWLFAACFCMFLYLVFGIVAYAIAVWLDPIRPSHPRPHFGRGERNLLWQLDAHDDGLYACPDLPPDQSRPKRGRGRCHAVHALYRVPVWLVAWGAILLLARMPFFAERYGDMTLLCVFSFGGHCCILLGIFAVALMPKTVTRVAHCIINWLERMGVSATKIEGWRTFVDGEIYSFSEKFKLSAGHFSSMLLTVVITMLQLAFFYLVPYFLMLSFGHHEVDFFSVMAASAFVQLLSSAVPLPGGTGGAEGGFALFLGHFFGTASTAGYLLWRLITFIAPTILAAPLLGLKSAHNESIHARWDRMMRKLGRTPQTPSTPVKAHPACQVTVDPNQRAQKPAVAPKPARQTYVRQTGDGIRVSPAALNKKKRS